MYRCQSCSRVPAAGTPQHRVVTATRVRQYPFRREIKVVYHISNGKRKKVKIDDLGGIGVEIAAEMTLCPECARLLQTRKPVSAATAVA